MLDTPVPADRGSRLMEAAPLGEKPTLTRKGYAVRDAEVKISKRGTEYVLVKVRLAVEDPARFVDAYVAGRDRERAAGRRQGRRRGVHGLAVEAALHGA